MSKKVFIVGEVLFLLFIVICIGLIYIVHKYFGKYEFYFLGVIYIVISFLMSFKLINIFGLNINPSIIFSSGLLAILYYFIKRYDVKEYKKFSMLVLITNVVLYMFLLSNAFMIPSIYDKTSSLYQSLVLDNLVMFITYPIAMIVTLCLGGYCFKTLKEEKEKKNIKIIATIVGLMFIDTFIFIYFSYAFLIRFDKAIIIAIENYFIKSIIMIIYVFIINKILSVKKVK